MFASAAPALLALLPIWFPRLCVQTRLQRCVEGCNDTARDTLSAAPTEPEIAKAQALANTCGMKCCEDMLVTLPKLEARLTEQLR